MARIDRRPLLRDLETTELLALARRYELDGAEEAPREELIEMLAETVEATMGQMLVTLPRTRLKQLCRKRGLDDGGRAKSLIATRLLGLDPMAPPTPKAVPPIRRRRRLPED